MRFEDIPREQLVELITWCRDNDVVPGVEIDRRSVVEHGSRLDLPAVYDAGCGCCCEAIPVPEHLQPFFQTPWRPST